MKCSLKTLKPGSWFLVIVLLVSLYYFGKSFWVPVVNKLRDRKTTSEAVSLYEEKSELRLKPFFNNAGIKYPPAESMFLAIKETRVLELWAKDKDGIWTFIRTYPLLGASGKLGPKLVEGDHQVPEGVYEIEYLNPNSSYHLSMKLNYPNAFDKKWADCEGRDNPGTNIFIHGKSISVGCLAMGDYTIEELFILTSKVGIQNTRVIISPIDPRKGKLVMPKMSPHWVSELYENIYKEFIKVSGVP